MNSSMNDQDLRLKALVTKTGIDDRSIDASGETEHAVADGQPVLSVAPVAKLRPPLPSSHSKSIEGLTTVLLMIAGAACCLVIETALKNGMGY